MGLLDALFGKKKPQQQVNVAVPPDIFRVPLEVTTESPQQRREVVNARDESKLPDNAILLGGKGRVQVKGESHYQDALNRICGGKCEEGHMRKVLAVLEPEFDNPYDSNAVAVKVDGQHVGYMDKPSAAAYKPLAVLLQDKGKVGAARAFIMGGWQRGGGDEGHYGIQLELSPTEELMKTRKVTAL